MAIAMSKELGVDGLPEVTWALGWVVATRRVASKTARLYVEAR